jgi:AAA+ ATPase superfamily predicted ATPase
MFYGRGRELGGILGVLGNPDKPGNVSILGEQRIGKSSLLNQIYQVLAAQSKFCDIVFQTNKKSIAIYKLLIVFKLTP